MGSDPNFLERIGRSAIAAPFRCFRRRGAGALSPCGARAAWLRPGGEWGMAGFYCDAHRGPLDVPIPSEVIWRRVRLLATVDLAGTAWVRATALAEACARLEAAVAELPGLVQRIDGTTDIVRYVADRGGPGAPPGDAPAGGQGGGAGETRSGR